MTLLCPPGVMLYTPAGMERPAVTVAPLQGISDVTIKNNADGSEYLSVSFAGPIRSAGGTEAALTMLIADHARKVAGLATYKANSFDDETGRFVEELRIYEREVMGFQFKVLDAHRQTEAIGRASLLWNAGAAFSTPYPAYAAPAFAYPPVVPPGPPFLPW